MQVSSFSAKDEPLDTSVFVRSPFPFTVIPGLTRNPVFEDWIPAFVGMTA